MTYTDTAAHMSGNTDFEKPEIRNTLMTFDIARPCLSAAKSTPETPGHKGNKGREVVCK